MKKLFVILSVVTLAFSISPLEVYAESINVSNDCYSFDTQNQCSDSIIVTGDGNNIYYYSNPPNSEEQNQTESNKTNSKFPNLTLTIPIPAIKFFRRKKRNSNGKTKH